MNELRVQGEGKGLWRCEYEKGHVVVMKEIGGE